MPRLRENEHQLPCESALRLARLLAVCLMAATSAIAPGTSAVAQQVYPARPITIIVPYSAGGTTDQLARSVADILRKQSGQAVLVENVTGAGGSIAGRRAINAPADGYTLFMTSSGIHAVTPTVYKDFKPAEGLTQVTTLVDAPFVMVTSKEFPAKTMRDYVQTAQQNPGKVTIGNVSMGSHGHLAQLIFGKAAGVELLSVPYKGSTPAITDLLGGQINSMMDNVGVQKPYIDGGRVQALFVTSPRRSPALPQVPTALELGLQFESMSWFGLAAPKQTPSSVVHAVRDMVAVGFQDTELRTKLQDAGLAPVVNTPAEADARAAEDARVLGVIAATLKLPQN